MPFVYDDVDIVSHEGLRLVQRADKWGYVDNTGREVIPAIYDSAHMFKNAQALVNIKGDLFYINHQGVRLE